MISFLSGEIRNIFTEKSILEINVSGVGYEIALPSFVMDDVINTGTMLGGREVLQEINWPEKFPIMVEKLKKLQDDDETMFPPALHSRFAFDNETMTSYLVKSENFKYASLSDEWHGRLPDNGIDPNHKIIHAINKRFEFIWPDVNFEGRKF